MAKSSLYNKVLEIKNIKDTTITPYNLRSGINAYGITGNYTNGANILPNDVASGKVGYANGSTITGALRQFTNETINVPVAYSVNYTSNLIAGKYNANSYITENNRSVRVGEAILRDNATVNMSFNQLSSMLNIQPMQIKKDVKVLDIVGQYDASTEFSGIKMDPVKPSASSTPLVYSITEISGLDMTEGTNLSAYFNGLKYLRSVSNINTPNVTNLVGMFRYCSSLSNISYLNFYNDSQSNVWAFQMFQRCYNLKNVDNSIRFPKCIYNSYQMFEDCANLQVVNTPMRIINNCDYMFNGCRNLVNINQNIIIRRGFGR